MTKEQIVEESMKPSTQWIEAGSGSIGKVYFEVLSAYQLPNMDALTANISDKTDAFGCIVFEDSVVMTDIITDTLSPRWMPWSRRAFVFNISHPSSIINVGIFDFDPELSPLQMVARAAADVHDPIGRIQIHLSNFSPGTVYTVAVRSLSRTNCLATMGFSSTYLTFLCTTSVSPVLRIYARRAPEEGFRDSVASLSSRMGEPFGRPFEGCNASSAHCGFGRKGDRLCCRSLYH